MKNLPKGWKYVPLGDVLTMAQYGLSMSSSDQGQYPMFRMNNFRDGKVVAENLVYVDLPDKEAAKFLLQPNDILFNRTNSQALVGKTGLFNTSGDYVFASYLVRLRVNEEVADPRFVNYFLNDDKTKQELKALSTAGVSQSNINPTTLRKKLRLPLPPLAEQQRIAAILSACDRALEGTALLLEKQAKRKQALLQRLISVHSESIPSTWKVLELSEFVEKSSQKFYPADATEQSICVELEHVSQVTGELLGTTFTSSASSTKNRFSVGEVLFGKLRPYLRKYLLAGIGGVCSSEFWVLRGKADKCLNPYLFYLVQSESFVQACTNTTGSKMPRADWNWVCEQPFPLPPMADQQRIADTLSSCDKELTLLRQQHVLLQQQKKGLMQRLLTGQSFTH